MTEGPLLRVHFKPEYGEDAAEPSYPVFAFLMQSGTVIAIMADTDGGLFQYSIGALRACGLDRCDVPNCQYRQPPEVPA